MSTQPKPESWLESARRAWEHIKGYYAIECNEVEENGGEAIILAAIERSHAADAFRCRKCGAALGWCEPDVCDKCQKAAQPKPESWPEIARGAEQEMRDMVNESFVTTSDWHKRRESIILSAIERSHAAFPVQVAEPLDGASADHAIPEGRTGGSNPPTGAHPTCPDCKQELSGDEMLDREIHGRCQSQGEAQPQPSKASSPQQPNLPCGCTIKHGDSTNSSVFWNEFNRVVQCHKCGQVYEPASPLGERSEHPQVIVVGTTARHVERRIESPSGSGRTTDDKQEWWVEQTADGDWSLGSGNRGFALFDEQSVALDVRDRHNAALREYKEKAWKYDQLNK